MNKTKIFLLALVLIGVCLRLFKFSSIPVGLYWDEVAMLVDAKSVAGTGLDMHGNHWLQAMFVSYGDYKLPIYIWLASASVKLLGVSEIALRLPSLMAGLGTIVITGELARQLAKRWLPKVNITSHWLFSSMVVVALSPWAIMFSRTGFEGHVGQLLLAISILVLFLPLKKPWLLVLTALLGALATYAYFSVRFVWPVVFITAQAFIILSEQNKQLWPMLKNVVIRVLIPLVLFVVFLVPLYNSPHYQASNQYRYSTTSVLSDDQRIHEQNNLRQIAGNTPLDRIIFHRWILLSQDLLENVSDNMSFEYLFLTGDPNLRHGTGEHGLFLILGLPFFVIGFFGLLYHWPIWILLVVWWLTALLPASVPETTPHALRSLNALVPLSLFIGYGAALTIERIQRFRNSWLRLSLTGFLIMVTFANVFAFSYHYFLYYPQDSARAWQSQFKEMSLEVTRLYDQADSVYIRLPDERFYLWLMAYGPFEPQQFTTWPSTNYAFTEFEKIHAKSYYDFTTIHDDTVIVVTSSEVTEPQLTNYTVSEETVFVIPQTDVVYRVQLLEKS